jgi:hypothetical protein
MKEEQEARGRRKAWEFDRLIDFEHKKTQSSI